MSATQRLFVGCYPTGLVYADSWVDDKSTRDFQRLGYLNYESCELDLEDTAYTRKFYKTEEGRKIREELLCSAADWVQRYAGTPGGYYSGTGIRYWEGQRK